MSENSITPENAANSNSSQGDSSNIADDNYLSFINTPSPARNSPNSWNSRSNQRRNHNYYSPNQNFRHSTPHNRANNRMYNRPNHSSPFHRGRKNNSHNDSNQFNATSYFHLSMLDNPWAELEKKYEKTSSKPDNSSQNKYDSSDTSSESDSEHEA